MLPSVIVTPKCAIKPTEDDIINKTIIENFKNIFKGGGFLVYNKDFYKKYTAIVKEKWDPKFGPKFLQIINYLIQNRGVRVNEEFSFIDSNEFNVDYAEFLIVSSGEKWGISKDSVDLQIGPYKKNTIVKFRGIATSSISERIQNMSEIYTGNYDDNREEIVDLYSIPIQWCDEIEIIDPYAIRQIFNGGLKKGRTKSGIEVLLERIIAIRNGKPLKRLRIYTVYGPITKNEYQISLKKYKFGEVSKDSVRNAKGFRDSHLGMLRGLGNLINRFEETKLYENLEFVGIEDYKKLIHNRFVTFRKRDAEFILEINKGIGTFSNLEKGRASTIKKTTNKEDINKHRAVFQNQKLDSKTYCIEVERMGPSMKKQITKIEKEAWASENEN